MPKKTSKGARLNIQQKKFAAEYLIDGNATQAAIRAGYKPKAAGQQGHDLLKNAKIAAIIEAGVERKRILAEAKAARAAEKYEVTEERWLAEVSAIAYSDMDKVATVTERGVHIIPTEERHVGGRIIKKVSESKGKNGRQQSIELHNKMQALELIAKHKGFIKDRTEFTGEGGSPVKVNIMLPANGREPPKKEDDESGGQTGTSD